ncbi:MAG: hypothetical protein ACTSW4_03110 [Candidatus Ranarchaeia archaeon]
MELKESNPIWAHVNHTTDLKIKGSTESLVGRDWDSKGAGRKLSNYGLYWTPGSILMESKTIEITKVYGLWEAEWILASFSKISTPSGNFTFNIKMGAK